MTAALDAIEREYKPEKSPLVSVVGHCLGAAILAQAIAGEAKELKDRISRIVLLALGLFYEGPLDTRLKSEDYTLERLLHDPENLVIDPRRRESDSPVEWPKEFEALYENWPAGLHPHPGPQQSDVKELCNRLCYMYGAVYREANLAPEFHDRTTIVRFKRGVRKPAKGSTIVGEHATAIVHSMHKALTQNRVHHFHQLVERLPC